MFVVERTLLNLNRADIKCPSSEFAQQNIALLKECLVLLSFRDL
jgi:hypothetical protein